jgi:hypothetical protein
MLEMVPLRGREVSLEKEDGGWGRGHALGNVLLKRAKV